MCYCPLYFHYQTNYLIKKESFLLSTHNKSYLICLFIGWHNSTNVIISIKRSFQSKLLYQIIKKFSGHMKNDEPDTKITLNLCKSFSLQSQSLHHVCVSVLTGQLIIVSMRRALFVQSKAHNLSIKWQLTRINWIWTRAKVNFDQFSYINYKLLTWLSILIHKIYDRNKANERAWVVATNEPITSFAIAYS